MSINGTAQTEYASLSGKIHTIVVDKTLSISGACADAKATGDEVEKLYDISDDAKKSYEDAKAAYDEAISGMQEAARVVAQDVAKEEVSKLEAADVGAYSKEESISASTKTKFGLGSDAVPDDALAVLSRFHKGLGNEYVWAKSDSTGVVGYVNSPDPNAYPPAVSDGYTYTPLGQLGAGLKIELMWENASPLSYFPGQTISMDLSDVSQIMVMFRWDNTSDRDYVSKQLIIPVGGKGRNQEYGNGGVRTITVSTAGVTISDDSKGYTYDQPWYIYGIKGVTS